MTYMDLQPLVDYAADIFFILVAIVLTVGFITMTRDLLGAL